MTQAERVPGAGWYVLAGVVAVAATVAGIGIGVWLFQQYESAVPFLAPGRHTLELKKPGSYLVWNDYRTLFQGRSYDESKHLPSGARIAVVDRASGRELPVEPDFGASVTSGSAESVSVARFNIAQPGSYEIVVHGGFPPRVMSVGRNLIFQLAGGLFGAFALVGAGYCAALIMVLVVFLKRDQAARAASGDG
jgi:hypothetical protein